MLKLVKGGQFDFRIRERGGVGYYDQKNSSFFSLDFKTMLTKH